MAKDHFNYSDVNIPEFNQINTVDNLEWRAQALEIHRSIHPKNLSLIELKKMLELVRKSISPAVALEDIIDDDIKIIDYVQNLYPEATLGQLRELFRQRAFPEDLVGRWINSDSNIRSLTADTISDGYPEYAISTTPHPYWQPVDGIEYFRRIYIDQDINNANNFRGFYEL